MLSYLCCQLNHHEGGLDTVLLPVFSNPMPSSLLKIINGTIQFCNVLHRCDHNYVRAWSGDFSPQASHRHNFDLGLLEFHFPMVE